MDNFNVKKVFLYLLTCSIVLGALMGIWAIISGEFGELQGQILLTTLTVVGTSVLGLACGAFLESPRNTNLKAVPLVGIALAVLCGFVSFWLIWQSSDSINDGAFKLFFVSLIFAFSLAQLSLLSMAHLAQKFRWSLVSAYIVIFILDFIISAIIVFELNGDDGFVLRLIGILSVVAASLTVMIPIFHRLSRADFARFETRTADDIDAEITNFKTQISHLEKQKEDILNDEIGS